MGYYEFSARYSASNKIKLNVELEYNFMES